MVHINPVEMLLPTSAVEDLRVAVPEVSRRYEQDAEWCVVQLDGRWREIRFHDYAEVYEIPGLYERIFYGILECRSPDVLRDALATQLHRDGVAARDLRVLDLGAGNGIMGERLAVLGVEHQVGVDILPEAKRAAERDRATVYSAYHVLDMMNLPADDRAVIAGERLNTLACVAALGFGDIPPECFRTAFNLIEDGGWIVFTIKDDFLSDRDTTGFAGMIAAAVEDGMLELRWTDRYVHRLATDRSELRYTGVVARKRGDLPPL